MTEKTENEIRVKAKQVTDNLISFMQELDTVTNKENKELKIDAEYYQKRLQEFEKENFQLKQKNQKLEKKVEQAKLILKDLLSTNADWTHRLEAEQFLKEIEK